MQAPPLTRRALPERLPPWGVGVFESHHAPDFEMEWRRHPFLKVLYVLSGAGALWLEGAEFPFAERDVLVAPAGQRNRIVDQVGQPASLYVLCLSRKLLRFDPSVEDRLRAGAQPRTEELANRAARCFRRLLFQQADGSAARSVAMAATTLELVHLLTATAASDGVTRTKDAVDEDITRHVGWLDSHFYEATTIDAAAASVGMSRRAFTQAFRRATGQSWLGYVHARAVEHAGRLLAETDAPIASIAFECGFGDLSTFYRRFKGLQGCTPLQWRARHREQQ